LSGAHEGLRFTCFTSANASTTTALIRAVSEQKPAIGDNLPGRLPIGLLTRYTFPSPLRLHKIDP
jgi:hypothetical protein